MTERIASLHVERRRLADLKLHPENPRKHPKPGSPAWEVLKRSLDDGYFLPIVLNVRNGFLVAGHFRLKVMRSMGFTEADVVIVDYDEPKHIARMIAANVLLGEFEETIMASLAKKLDEAGIDQRPDLKKKSKPELIAIIDEIWNSQASTVIRQARTTSDGLHPTIKPLPLVAGHIWNSSKRGETVVELFNGSGTTMAAAHHTGRRCVATELDEKYVAVGLERMSLLGLQVEKLR